jgi:hypothetical protein
MSGDENCHRPPAPAAGRPFSASPPRAQLDTDPHPGGQPHPQEGGLSPLPKNCCPDSCQILENLLHRGMRVAALYVDPRGPYPKIPGVDCWDAERDARLYAGPWPVIAHPPCGPWGYLQHLYRGSEHDCAPTAVEQVRTFGGVLEHPAHSRLWPACSLPLPGEPADRYGGRTYEVCQCDWGHVARKRTWLYVVRCAWPDALPPPRKPTHWASGGRRPKDPHRTPVPQGIKVCSAQQRRRTPPEFALWLVELAESAVQQ